MARVKYISKRESKNRMVALGNFPSFHASGSVSGMKKLYYGKNALLVRCGAYIYNVSSAPHIYYNLAH